LGFDRPFHEQFILWVGNALRGDFGVSISPIVRSRSCSRSALEPTIALAVMTTIVAIVFAVRWACWQPGRPARRCDRGVMSVAVLGFSFPVFRHRLCADLHFRYEAQDLPIQGYRPLADGLWPFLRHLILPSVALA